MKGTFAWLRRGVAWLYFLFTIFGFVTGLGGGDSRGFFLALIVLGIAVTLSYRYLSKKREEPLGSGDVIWHLIFSVWCTGVTIGFLGLHKSVWVEVPSGYIAATFQGSEIRQVITEPGLYFKTPFASFKKQQRVLGYEVNLPAFTSDGVKVPVLVKVSAAVSPENLNEIFKANPQGTALAPVVEEALREAVARSATRYSEQEIDENRRKLESAVRDAASSDLKGHFVELKEMQLAVFSPEDSVH